MFHGDVYTMLKSRWNIWKSGKKHIQEVSTQAKENIPNHLEFQSSPVFSELIPIPETNSLPLKTDGWKMKFLLGMAYFQGNILVLGRVDSWLVDQPSH